MNDNKMNKENLEKIKRKVEEKLSSFSNLNAFKIGKTVDCKERFEKEYQKKDYNNLWVLATGNPKAINEGEKFLINYFLNHPRLEGKCNNEREGGGGNPNATLLYLVVDYSINDIDCLDEGLYQDEWEIINLDEL